MIYADHAATTPLHPKAREAMEPYLCEWFANPSGQYRFGLECRRAVELSRRKIAACLGCRAEEIYFTSGGSEGNTWAIWNAAGQDRLLVTTAIEHHSLLNACRGAAALGASVRLLPVDGFGCVRAEQITGAALVSVQYANNEVGTIQPIDALSRLCREQGVPLHTDAVQAVGHIPTAAAAVDLLTASAHKFGGPKGIGFLYVRTGIPLSPLICGGGQENGLRGGTENVAAIAGMAAALEYAVAEMDSRRKTLERMEAEFRAVLLDAVPQVRFNGGAEKLPGLISVTIPGYSAERLVYRMDMAEVCVSAGAACDSRGRTEPSHVLTAMGLSAADAACTLRVSFGCANAEEDGREAAQRLVKILQDR